MAIRQTGYWVGTVLVDPVADVTVTLRAGLRRPTSSNQPLLVFSNSSAEGSSDRICTPNGTEGGLDVHFKEGESRLSISHGPDLGLGKWRRLRTGKVKSNYQRFIDAIGQGKAVDPDFARGAQLQGLLDLAVISDAQGGAIKSTN